MINQSKLYELFEAVANALPCVCCPHCNECPYIYVGDKQECIKQLEKWISSV
jgi:hypothetical protein